MFVNIIIGLVSLILGVFIGMCIIIAVKGWGDEIKEMEKSPFFNDDPEMADWVKDLESINANSEQTLREKYDLLLPIATSSNSSLSEDIQSLLIEEFGSFYYNYTYEDERYMNPEYIEVYLNEFEELAKGSELFKKVIAYKVLD